jgi:DNA-binding NarL/FixJ family response regulator
MFIGQDHLNFHLTDGFTNKKISSSLSISESTVENHIHHIYVKLGISNRTQAVILAFQLRIVVLQIT